MYRIEYNDSRNKVVHYSCDCGEPAFNLWHWHVMHAIAVVKRLKEKRPFTEFESRVTDSNFRLV